MIPKSPITPAAGPHRAEIVAAIAGVLADRPAEYWLSLLHQAGVPVATVQGLSEVVADRQAVARESVLPTPGSDGAR